MCPKDLAYGEYKALNGNIWTFTTFGWNAGSKIQRIFYYPLNNGKLISIAFNPIDPTDQEAIKFENSIIDSFSLTKQ